MNIHILVHLLQKSCLLITDGARWRLLLVWNAFIALKKNQLLLLTIHHCLEGIVLRRSDAKDMTGNLTLFAESKFIEPLDVLQFFFIFFCHWKLWSLKTCFTVETLYLCFLYKFLCKNCTEDLFFFYGYWCSLRSEHLEDLFSNA